jgi:nucleoid-associated protein EbfC
MHEEIVSAMPLEEAIMSSPFDALGPLMAGFQSQVQKLKDEAAKVEVEGTAGGGAVKIVMNGKQEVVRVALQDSSLGDREMLEDLIAAATNDALRRSKEALAEKLSALTGGLPIPPGLI